MDLLGQIDRLKPGGEGALEVACQRGFAPSYSLLEFSRSRRVTTATRDGERAIALDQCKKLFAPLIAQNFANQRAEHMHIVAQRGVLGRKLDLGAIHRMILHP
jgi:hypothetical protein